MVPTFYYSPDTDLKAQTLALWNGQPLLPAWYAPNAVALNGSTLTATAVSGVPGKGFCAAMADAASGVYLVRQQRDSLVYLSSGGTVTTYPVTSGTSTIAFTGGCMAMGYPYMVDADGNISTLVSGAVIQLASGFGAPSGQFSRGLGAIGSTLYTLVIGTDNVASFTLSAQTSGAPGYFYGLGQGLLCFAASGKLAVGGFNYASFSSGYNGLAVEPSTNQLLLGVNAASGYMDVYSSSGSGVWAATQHISGIGAPVKVTWTPNDQTAFTSDPTNNAVMIFTNTFGTLVLSQTLTVTNALATAVMSDSLHALVAQGSANQLTNLTYNGASWAVSGTVALTNPTAVLSLGPAAAVASCASGVANLTMIAGVWSVISTVTLPFTPTALAVDPNSSTVYAAGASGGYGYLVAVNGNSLTSLRSWGGGAVDVAFVQGQISTLDNTGSSFIRNFSLTAGQLVQQSLNVNTPAPATAIAWAGTDYFVASSGTYGILYQYVYGAPYTLNRRKTGFVATLDGTLWHQAALGVTGIPTAITFDPSGNLTIATQNNQLVSVSSSGAAASGINVAPVLGISGISQASGQTSGVPLGISSLMYSGSALYASTILNDALLRLL